MFKPGQVVKSLHTGVLYVVQEQDGKLLKAKAIRSQCVFDVNAEHMRLIGNNYQQKDINKALREVST